MRPHVMKSSLLGFTKVALTANSAMQKAALTMNAAATLEEQHAQIEKLQRERDVTKVKVIARERYSVSEARFLVHDYLLDEIGSVEESGRRDGISNADATKTALVTGIWLGYGKRIGQSAANLRATGADYETNEVFMAVLAMVSFDVLSDPWAVTARLREGPGQKVWAGQTSNGGRLGGADDYAKWQGIFNDLADVLDPLLEGELRVVAQAPPTRQAPIQTPWPSMPMVSGDPKKELLRWGAEIMKRSVGMSVSERHRVVGEGLATQFRMAEEAAAKKGEVLSGHEIVAWKHVMTSLALVAVHWAQGGYPTLRPTHRLTASLMATHIPKELVPEVRLPWPSFLVEVPEGILPIDRGDCEYPGVLPLVASEHVIVRVVGLVTSVAPDGREELVMFVGSSYSSPDEVVRRTVHIADMEIKSLAQLAELEGFEGLYAPALVRLLGRFLLNMIIEVDSPSYRNEIGRGPPRTSAPKKGGRDKGALPSTWVVEVRREVKLDARAWVADYVRSNGTSPSVQTLVRGHRKRQVYGPRSMSLRRWIHVEPYWRGPEDAPVVARTMVMDGAKKETGA